MNPTQTRILQYLRNHPAATTAAISRALGMTPANIRHHLHILQGTGLIEASVSPSAKSRGRPELLYQLSLQAQSQNLHCLLDILLEILESQPASGTGAPLAQMLAEQLIKRGKNLAALQPMKSHLTQRLTAVSQSLDQFQYQARWEAHTSGPRFIFSQCPYLALVDRHPILCQMDVYLLEKLLSRSIRQISRIRQGTPQAAACIFEVGLQPAG